MSSAPPDKPSKQSAPGDPGVPFGRFRLLDKIGEGDISEVYRAVAVGVEGFERRIAIKVMQAEVREEKLGGVFSEEARVTAMLDHPGVAQVFEFGVIDNLPFIAMEYLRGKNLDETLNALREQGERLSPSLAVFIAHQVAGALAHASELEDERGRSLGLVHGEVIPANIMLVREGAVKLLDFGVTAVTHDPRYTLTRRGRPLPRHAAYLSPEQVAGKGADKRSDVFSLGVVLWEMLTGRRLFAGKNDRDTRANVMRAEILPPSRLAAEIPPALDRVVLAALVRDVGRRYRGAEALARDLEEVIRTVPSRHGDLTALLERVWGTPRDTGPVKTLAAQTNPLAAPPPPPSRPDLSRTTTPRPHAAVEPERLADAGREPTTRLMGDTTLAALLGREPRRRVGSWWRSLGDPRALLIGGAGLVVGLTIAAAVLSRETPLVEPVRPPISIERAAAPAVAARPPAVVSTPVPRPSCDSPDAGPPCLGPVVEPPPAVEPRTAEPRAQRPGHRSPKGASQGQAPAEQSAIPPLRPLTPARGGLDDRRPNPFDE